MEEALEDLVQESEDLGCSCGPRCHCQDPWAFCDRCGVALYDDVELGRDDGTYCESCCAMVEVTYQPSIVDLDDPWISITG